MTEAAAQPEQSNDVFDRLLGRKGDAMRLDPAINAVVKFLGARLQTILQNAGLEAGLEVVGQQHSSASAEMGKNSSGAICVVLGTKSANPSAYLICDYSAVSIIAEIMLGGDPEFASLSASRAPTSMERDLVRQFADMTGQAIQTTLSTPDCPKTIRLAQTVEEIRDGEDEEPVVAFETTLVFGEATPTLTLAIAHSLLLRMARPVRETVKKPASGGAGTQNRNALTVKVPVSGSIQLPPITLGELAALCTGDVLALSAEADATVKLKVKGRPLYDCSLGRKGANYAMCLQRPHEAMTEALNGIGLSIPNPDLEETYDE